MKDRLARRRAAQEQALGIEQTETLPDLSEAEVIDIKRRTAWRAALGALGGLGDNWPMVCRDKRRSAGKRADANVHRSSGQPCAPAGTARRLRLIFQS